MGDKIITLTAVGYPAIENIPLYLSVFLVMTKLYMEKKTDPTSHFFVSRIETRKRAFLIC
jgi:hypothetical protein